MRSLVFLFVLLCGSVCYGQTLERETFVIEGPIVEDGFGRVLLPSREMREKISLRWDTGLAPAFGDAPPYKANYRFREPLIGYSIWQAADYPTIIDRPTYLYGPIGAKVVDFYWVP